jgi:hypothetical protein
MDQAPSVITIISGTAFFIAFMLCCINPLDLNASKLLPFKLSPHFYKQQNRL